MEAIVKLQSVTKDYGKGNVIVHALRGIDLELAKGSFVAVAGPSGSGKSTLLNIISGLDQPSSGKVLVDGKDVGAMTRSQLSRLRLMRIGFVFQAYNLLPVLTALENLEFIPALQGESKEQRTRRAEELLEAVGLAGIRDKRPNELSGGQQQRVAVLRAILTEPEVVLADEPTANLDSANASLLLDMMEKLNREKQITFLFSTHDPLVMERARRLVRLRDGLVVSDENRERGGVAP